MDVIVASSRGHGLKKFLKQTPILATSGARLVNLAQDASKYLKKQDPEGHYHVYFLAGLCDVTYRDRDGSYEEFVFNESPWEARERVGNVIREAAAIVTASGATPCFATITPCDLEIWNNHRLTKHFTSHLLHFRHYDSMQQNLIQAIILINKDIVTLNQKNNIVTPFIADISLHKRGDGKKHRQLYKKFHDGTHPDDVTLRKWAEVMDKVMRRNSQICQLLCSGLQAAEEDLSS